MPAERLILGIDGGGTKTVAWLARPTTGEPEILGRGSAGPSNIQSVGFAAATESLDQAIAAAFDAAGIPRVALAAAVVALAGSDRDENRAQLACWAQDHRVAQQWAVVHDAQPVLRAGSPENWGVALIAGTGSLAFGRSRDGRTTRAGGWGFLFGDEGSGYSVALAGLRAVMHAHDGRGPETALTEAFLARLGLLSATGLILAVYPHAADRAWVASLADTVVECSRDADLVAGRILDQAADDLSAMVEAVARRLDLGQPGFPLALSGGMLLASAEMRERLAKSLERRGLTPGVVLVPQPVFGAVCLAQDLVAKAE